MFFLVIVSRGVSYRLATTQMGNPKLFTTGFGYIFHRGKGGGLGWWQCDVQRKTYCPARLVVQENELIPKSCHNHPPDNSKF